MAATLKIKNSSTPTTAPTGLTAGEMAVNLADKKLYIGGTGATNTIFLDSTAVAVLSTANTFTQLNTFSAGISASGATFSGNIKIPVNTTGAITIGTHASKNLTLGSIDSVGEIVQVGNSTATLNIRQVSGGIVSIGDYNGTLNSNYISVDDTNDQILINGAEIQLNGIISTPLTLSSTLSAAGATFSGNISAPNIVNSFNGATGAVTGITAGGVNTFTALNSFSVGISAAGATFSGPIISTGYQISSGAINAQTASYSLVAGDNGKIVTMNVGSANNLTVPASLAVGFNCTVIQLGAGQTTILASGTTLNSYQGYLKISGQHGSASIVGYTSNVYNVAGNLSA